MGRIRLRSTIFVGVAAVALLAWGCGGDSGSAADVPGTGDVLGDAAGDAGGDGRLLHVPSPDWRDQVIYFVMIDRFANGDPTNDDQGAGEYDPTSGAHWSGGDLQGVIDRLDYIQGIGATAVWITPPVANQWWDPLVSFGGYHGYWARHFKEVDAHFGTLETYRDLSDALHRRGMYLIQDIVPNHVGNYFTWQGAYDPDDPAQNLVRNTGSVPTAAPTQPPFDQNDPSDPEHRAAAIYHWTPAIADYNDPVQELTWQVSDLDDLNTGNPVVRTALKDSFGYWIREVGVDGFRIDTAKFVEHEFWNDFVHSDDPAAPGVAAVAAETGRDDFLTFGEVFEVGEPLSDEADRKVTSFLGTEAAPELQAVLGFPLYAELDRVLTGGGPTRWLAWRLERFMDRSLYRDPYVTPNFVDNHDVERFITSGSLPALRQALTLVLTIPGIPVLYYGTEQGFTETRSAMFAGGFGAGGTDHFDTEAPLYRTIAALVALRRGDPVFTRGDLTVLRDSPAGPGALVYRREHEGATALVVFNTADEPVLLADLDTGRPAGTAFEALFAEGGAEGGDPADPAPLVVGPAGRLLAALPPRAAWVLRAATEPAEPPTPGATITVETPLEGATLTADLEVRGSVEPADTALVLVIDDYLERALPIEVAADGTWSVTIPAATFPYGTFPHTATVYAPQAAAPASSPRFAFTTDLAFDGEIVSVEDPVGDDTGPAGTYFYPQDPTFSRQGDVVGVDFEVGPVTLTLRVEMREISQVWRPGLGFDHVNFTIFFDIPGRDGLTFLPRLQADAPEGFAWDLGSMTHGWGNNLFSSEGTTPEAWGPTLPGAPEVTVSVPARTVSFTYDASRLGLDGWEGVQVYLTTWDFDGIEARYRALSPEGDVWQFGGGEPTDPYILDDVGPVTLPALGEE